MNDIGRVVSPTIVRGQIEGGAVQGIGQALCEAIRYDADSGQLVSASFMDYALPHADTFIGFRTVFDTSVPCTTNLLGVKGVGELGTIGATPAVVNAVVDALAAAGLGRDADHAQIGHLGHVARRKLDIGGGDGELPALGHRIARVDREVQQRVLELRRIDQAFPQAAGHHRLELDRLAEGPVQHVVETAHEAAEIDHLGLERLPPAEGQELRGELGAALAAAILGRRAARWAAACSISPRMARRRASSSATGWSIRPPRTSLTCPPLWRACSRSPSIVSIGALSIDGGYYPVIAREACPSAPSSW